MNALNFPIGVKTFDVNDGAAQISFNPTDVNFVSALYDLFAECAERYETDKDKLLGLGVTDALMMDGGGSTQGIFPKGKVTSSRKVPTLLLFWEQKAANPSTAPTKPEDPALAWGKAKGLLTDSNLEKPVTRAELVRVLYKLKGE